MIVTIDGPAASGKSTTARAVALALGFDYLDTGALYRCLTLAALEAGVPPEAGDALDALLQGLTIKYRYHKGRIFLRLGGRDVSEAIRGVEVTAGASAYSALPAVREHMVAFQRQYARGRDLVAEGRDMGSVVFPDAELKIFLVADPTERARRRARDFRGQGRAVDAGTVQAELERRDALDSGRDHSPLIRPAGAVEIDNSRMTIDEQVAAVMRLAAERRPARRVSPEELLWPVTDDAAGVARAERMRAGYRVTRAFLRGVMKLVFNTRYHHEERGRVPGPLLVASNHIGYLDPPAAGSAVHRELTFVAKRELFRLAPFAALIRYYNAVPIERGAFDRACFDTLRRRLQAGGAVFFFPEGTRKPVGWLGRAKFGLGLMAHESGAPVLPVYLRGTDRPLRAVLRRSRIDVYLGRPLHIAPLLDRGVRGRELYDLFGEGVMAEIARLQDEAGGIRGSGAA
ncbi:MAG: (d)CMP kinase [Candidatus Krumholzibacteriota bacterium]|nr:(d)CMP kinase [Candidatus Krumholzibacteriota bacterium]